jgi:sensor histidine kinase YesM
MATHHPGDLRWRLWLLVLAGWLLIGLTFTLNYYLFARQYVLIFRNPPTFKQMLVWEIPYWVLWAALSPIIFRLTRRFRLERGQMVRSSLIHAIACVLISIAHRAVYLPLGWLLHVVAYQQLSSMAELYRLLFLFNLPTGFMSYATILVVSYAIDYYQRYREEELRASELREKLAKAELQATQAQLQALKMQLQPHFLFNTLNSISALLDEDVEAADEMLARLGDFLRLTLENPAAQEISLQEEMEFLRCYLEIERVRFQDRLDVRINIEPAALDALVPSLVFQPLVENAIKHGILSRAAPGLISIEASVIDGVLQLRVTDNGPGLSSRQESGGRFREGLGLANVRARLHQLYGPGIRFDLADRSEGGLQVTLAIPFVASGAVVSEPVGAVK